jgi:putative hydrolase of the HAD superfamily
MTASRTNRKLHYLAQQICNRSIVRTEQSLTAIPSVEAMCFDLDDTLVQTTYFNDQSLNAVIKVLSDRHVSLGISEDEARKLVLQIKIQHGASYGKLFEELKAALAIDDEKVLTELTMAYDRFEDASLRLFSGAIELLKQLIQNRVKLCVVTNGDAYRQWKKMIATGIADLFDCVVISETAGVSKPDPRIFQTAISLLDSDPSETAFVGDRPDLDIKGARQAGMYTVRVLQGRAARLRAADVSEEADLNVDSIEHLREYLTWLSGA